MRFADQALVVLTAQLRMMRNMLSRRGTIATTFNLLVSGLWYVMALVLAVIAQDLFSNPPADFDLGFYAKIALLAITLYWQLTPVLTVSFGLALDLKRLRIFPIRPNQFYLMEMVLCVPTSLESLTLSIGVLLGLLMNPVCNPALVILAGAGFLGFNLCLNVAVRSLLAGHPRCGFGGRD